LFHIGLVENLTPRNNYFQVKILLMLLFQKTMISKKRKQKKEKLEIEVDESAVDVREKQKARK